jgi:hypothetical protein
MVDTLENNYLATLVVWLGCNNRNHQYNDWRTSRFSLYSTAP